MNSIRKIKKLTARYPIVIEIHTPSHMMAEQAEQVRRKLKQEFGSGIIVMMFHVDDEPIGVLKMPEISAEEKQKFINDFASAKEYIQQLPIESFTPIVKQKTFIHSVFALSKKQHKELSDRLEKHLISINPKN